MRTAIFLGLIYIGDALFKSTGLPITNLMEYDVTIFYGILTLIFMFMDIVDFIENLKRD